MLISEWLDTAVFHIKYKPDRADVSEELKAHYEDAKEALMQAGVDETAARNRAVASLGDPDAVGKLLAKVHRPLLPRLLKVCSSVLLILAVIVTAIGLRRSWDYFAYDESARFSPDAYVQSWRADLGEGSGWETTGFWDGSSKDSAKVGDYTVRVEKAARKTMRGSAGTAEDHCSALAILRVKGPFYLNAPQNIAEYMTAEDSNGNLYENIFSRNPGGSSGQKLVIGDLQPGAWRRNYIIVTVENADPAAEWMDLVCRREGASFSLKVHFDREAESNGKKE